MSNWLLITLSVLLLMSCANSSSEVKGEVSQQHQDYWYQGKAEITSYQLIQSRYGELREGEAVLIFVTEDFSTSKHLKLDAPIENSDDVQKVLKLNFIKKFNTGIYPYSMMLSTFTPFVSSELNHSLKVTCTSQEWCGQTFTQLKKYGGYFKLELFSYFEKEGEVDQQIKSVFLEDEIWNLIRLNPELIPTGKVSILPGFLFQRLSHSEFVPVNAEIIKEMGESTSFIKIEYPKHQRTLKINYNTHFPYEIIGWEESYPDGPNGEIKKTKAVKMKSIMSDYWTQNKTKDAYLRDSLGLD